MQTMHSNGTVERMAIVAFSGTVDKLMAVANLAIGGLAMGLEVDIFLTNWGLMAFRKGDYKTNMKISKEFEEYTPAMMAAMREKNVPNWMDILTQAKDLGELHIVACGQTLELFGMNKDALEDIVEEVTGVAAFIGRAQEAQITLFI
jgi:peroxiredoxin family protein